MKMHLIPELTDGIAKVSSDASQYAWLGSVSVLTCVAPRFSMELIFEPAYAKWLSMKLSTDKTTSCVGLFECTIRLRHPQGACDKGQTSEINFIFLHTIHVLRAAKDELSRQSSG